MAYKHICTAGHTSDVAQKVSVVVKSERSSKSPEQKVKMKQLLAKIANLEARGFIKRQQFKAPTTADFEREFACMKREDSSSI